MNKISKILKYQLCLGCGLCEALGKVDGCSMALNKNGFYLPKDYNLKELDNTISQICPAINVIAPKSNSVWGNIEEIHEAWSTNDEIRFKGSSGGVITSICTHLLESQTVSAILHVGADESHFLHNKLYVSKTKEDVIKRAASRYAPALVLNDILTILENTEGQFAFVGKPCDIAGLKNLINKYPQYKSKIKATIALFCAGMPSYNATKKLIELSNINNEPRSVKYRGEGWPGKFVVNFENNESFELSYNESWGGALHKDLNFRCKICPDGCGLLADIAVGDAWETKDGMPDFEETPGKSIVLTRNQLGITIFKNAVLQNYIQERTSTMESLKAMQPYQYERQFFVGYRLMVVKLLTNNIIKFNGIPITKLMMKYSLRKGISHALGTAKRLTKNT